MARKIWEKDTLYNILRPYVDWCTWQGFSWINVIGKENIPDNAAVILAPNHCNTLMDALVVLQCFRGPSSYGARADLFNNPTAAKALRFLKIVPIARKRDGTRAVAQNLEVFDEVVDILDHNVPFCIFSEGTHHASHRIQAVKKGIWRLAFLAQSKLDKPVYIVPVGLDYEYFFRTAGQIDVRFGKPISVSDKTEEKIPELCDLLHDSIQTLLQRPDKDYIDENGEFVYYKKRKRGILNTMGRIAAGMIMLPSFALFAIPNLPSAISSQYLIGKLKDKTWSTSMYVVTRVAFNLLLILLTVILGLTYLNIWWVIALLALLAISSRAFLWQANFYKDLLD